MSSTVMPMPSQAEPAVRTCSKTSVTSDGIQFISCKDSPYISLNYHRSSTGTIHKKSIWILSPADECHAFCKAEMGNWRDVGGDYWAISSDGQIEFGTRGERVAFFDSPQNITDPWHGYPVGGKKGLPTRKRPPDNVIELWYRTGWITYVTYSRLIGGRL